VGLPVVNQGTGSVWAVNKGLVQGSVMDILQARALGTSARRARDQGTSMWGAILAGACDGGHSAAFSFAVRAWVLAADETASGLVRFLDCSPAPYGSLVTRLHLGTNRSVTVSMLSTLHGVFQPCFEPHASSCRRPR